MRMAAILSLILLAPISLAWPAGAAAAKPPVLVELYTAQGCGSCDDANPYFARLAERPGVLALTFSVDYWDYLGWTDTFAQPAFTERQRAYVTRLKLREPYTPQIVVAGQTETQALKSAEVDRLVREAAATQPSPPDVRFVGAHRVDVGSGRAPRGGADVWLIRYDPREVETPVKAGDNRGATLIQRNVVRQIDRLGAWTGRPKAFRIPPTTDEGLRMALVVQTPKGGRVIAVAQPKG
jgi:hypothetical protein